MRVMEHGHEHLFTEKQEGYAFPVDNDLKYELVSDIDAFLFEINATWKLMKRLFGLLHTHVGRMYRPQKTRESDWRSTTAK